jgi:cellulose synthase/poly-beta-1,6-N-acetylglucosamine synthase-like glycosyltransferase
MQFALTVVLWLALFLLGYLYAGYPVVAWFRARVSPQPHFREPIAPVVTVVVVAYNEGKRIAGRIENLRALDYPETQLDIVIASDGSTDDTVARARAHVDSRVAVRAFPCRRGKAAVLNDVVSSARGEIVVLADARQRFEPDAVRALVSNLADPAVGAVSGELMLSSGTTATGGGVGFYWRYEKFIRRHESRTDSTVGATGAIYAIRRALFEPIPADTILDDVLIPLRMVRRGYRVLFDATARAVDGPSATARQEFVRKARTTAGMFQLFCRERWLLNPFRNRLWFETLSHKGLRLAAPLLQAVVLACSIGLSDVPLYRLLLLAQCAFYGAALAGWALGHRAASAESRAPSPESRAPSPELRAPLFFLSVPYAICLLNWATVVGFIRFTAGRQRATWEQAPLAPALPTSPTPPHPGALGTLGTSSRS